MERLVGTLILSALVTSQSLRTVPAFADEGPGLPIAASLGEPRDAGSAEPPMSVAQWMAQPWSGSARENATPNKPAAPPTELNKTTLPPYVIEPPDILAIEGIKLVPKAPHRLVVGDAVEIRVPGALPEFPIDGEFAIDAGGYVSLGLAYGRFKIADLTVEEAQRHIHEDLTRRFQLAQADVAISLLSTDDVQKITGQHLVAMDGRVNLGLYGSVFVTGMTIPEARAAIEKHLAKDFRDPTVSVDVLAYNSKVYYIITKDAGLGDDVVRCPITGNETVLDAVAHLGGISSLGVKTMWVARPAANHIGEDAILPVDWDAIAKGTSAATNYQLFPGDRLFIEPKQRGEKRLPPRAAGDSPYHLSDDVQYYAPQAPEKTPRTVAVENPDKLPGDAPSWQVETPRERINILGPLTSGPEVITLDPPSDDEVMRALEKSRSMIDILLQQKRGRNVVRIVKEKIADYADAPREYPLVGSAQNHHAHYKCTIYHEGGSDVVYVDHHHLHTATKGDPDANNPVEQSQARSTDAPDAVHVAAYDDPETIAQQAETSSREFEAGQQATSKLTEPTAAGERPTRVMMPPPIAQRRLPAATEPAAATAPGLSNRAGELQLHDIITVQVENAARSERDDTPRFNIACLISEILPNGNLRIDGQQTILTNSEQWTVRLSGQVHRGAIRSDGTVRSRSVANLELTNRAIEIETLYDDEVYGADGDPAPQVQFNISILSDLAGDVAELGLGRDGVGSTVADSATLLGALEALKKHGQVKVVADPTVVTTVGRPASLEMVGVAPPPGHEGAAPTGAIAINIVPREISLDEKGPHVTFELGMTKGGVIQCGADLHLGETLIQAVHDLRQASDARGPGQTYLVVTPELVE